MPASRDRGIWALWYDVRADRAQAYRQWLHGSHLPSLEKRGSFAWVAHYDRVDAPQGQMIR